MKTKTRIILVSFLLMVDKKEGFSVGDYELTDQRVILIAIIFVCLIMLINGNLKKGGHNNLKYARTFIPGGYNNIYKQEV